MRGSLICSVAEGQSPFEFTWYKDGRSIDDDDRVISTRIVDDYTSTLAINKLDASSNGNYSCRVSNSAGTDEWYTVLKLNGTCFRFFAIEVRRGDSQPGVRDVIIKSPNIPWLFRQYSCGILWILYMRYLVSINVTLYGKKATVIFYSQMVSSGPKRMCRM